MVYVDTFKPPPLDAAEVSEQSTTMVLSQCPEPRRSTFITHLKGTCLVLDMVYELSNCGLKSCQEKRLPLPPLVRSRHIKFSYYYCLARTLYTGIAIDKPIELVFTSQRARRPG